MDDYDILNRVDDGILSMFDHNMRFGNTSKVRYLYSVIRTPVSYKSIKTGRVVTRNVAKTIIHDKISESMINKFYKANLGKYMEDVDKYAKSMKQSILNITKIVHMVYGEHARDMSMGAISVHLEMGENKFIKEQRKVGSSILNMKLFLKDITSSHKLSRDEINKINRFINAMDRKEVINNPFALDNILSNTISIIEKNVKDKDISHIDLLFARKRRLMDEYLNAKFTLDRRISREVMRKHLKMNYEFLFGGLRRKHIMNEDDVFYYKRNKIKIANNEIISKMNVPESTMYDVAKKQIKEISKYASEISTNEIKGRGSRSRLIMDKFIRDKKLVRDRIISPKRPFYSLAIYDDIKKIISKYLKVSGNADEIGGIKMETKETVSAIMSDVANVHDYLFNDIFKRTYYPLIKKNKRNLFYSKPIVDEEGNINIIFKPSIKSQISKLQLNVEGRIAPSFEEFMKKYTPGEYGHKPVSEIKKRVIPLFDLSNNKTNAFRMVDKLIDEHQIKLRKQLGIAESGADIGHRYYVLGETMSRAIPTMPITSTNVVVKNVLNKMMKELNLSLKDVKVGYDGGDIILQIDSKSAIKGITGNKNIRLPNRIPDITIRIPDFKGNLYVKYNRLYAGTSGVDLIQSHNTARFISFGERIQNTLLDAELFNSFKDRLRFSASLGNEALRNDKILNELNKINYILNNKIDKILERSKDVHNDSVQETIMKAAKISDIHLERLFSSDYSRYLDKEIIRLSSQLSNGVIYKYVSNMRKLGFNVSEEDIKGAILDRIRRLKQRKSKTVHGERTINVVDDYVKSMQDIQRIIISKNGKRNVYTPTSVKFLPDAFSATITKLMKGELSLFDVAEMKFNLAFPYAKGTKPMFRPYQNAFGLSYGKYYENKFLTKVKDTAPDFTAYDKTLNQLVSGMPLNDAEVYGHILVNIDDNLLTSTEGNILLTESLGKKVLPTEVNAGYKMSAKKFWNVIRKLERNANGDRKVLALAKMLKSALHERKGAPITSKELFLNMFPSNDYTKEENGLRTTLPIEKVEFSRKVGNLFRKIGAIRHQDRKALDIIIKQFIFNPDGTVTMVYDAPHTLGPHSKIFTMHTKGIHNGMRLISANGVQNIIKSYTGKTVDIDRAKSIDAIITSKAWDKQRFAPIATGVMIETADQTIKSLAKEYNLSKDAITSIADEVIYSYLETVDPNFKDKTGFFDELVVLNKYKKPLKIGADEAIDLAGEAKEIRALWHETAYARLNNILNVNKRADVLMNALKREDFKNVLKKKMKARIIKLMHGAGASKEKVDKMLDDVLDKVLLYDNNGNLRQVIVKNFITVTKENPFELYKISKYVGRPYELVNDGIKFGINEYMVFKAIGLDEQAKTILSMKSLGHNYVENYYITLLRMLGFSDRDLENLYPSAFNKKKKGIYTKNPAKVLTYKQIKKIREILKKKEEDEKMGMFDWIKPGLQPADYIDEKTGLMKSIKVETGDMEYFMRKTEESLRETIENNPQLDLEDWKHIIGRSRADMQQSVLLSDREYKSLKEFLRQYHSVKIDDAAHMKGVSTYVGKVKLSGIDREISKLPLVRSIIDNKDAIKIKVPTMSAKGLKMESRWVLNSTLTNMVRLLRSLMNGTATTEEISDIVNKYYYELTNKAVRLIGEPVKSPAMMQIGIPKLVLDNRNDVKAILDAMGKQTRPGIMKMERGESALYGKVRGVWQIYPNTGEVIISKKSFVELMKARGDMTEKEALNLAADIINGQKNFMGNLVRFPTKDHKSILPVSFKLIDTDKIKDKTLRTRLEELMIINAIDGITLSGDWDKDIYFLTTLIAENKDKNTIETLTRYFSDLSYKINPEGKEFETKYIPTGRRSKALIESFKEVQGMIGTQNTKENLMRALNEGTRLTPDVIKDAIKKLRASNIPEEKLDEMAKQIIGNLKEIHGERKIDNLYVLSLDKKVNSMARDILEFLTPSNASTRALFGTENQTFLMDVLQKTYEAAGLRGKQLDEALHAIKVAKAMNVTSFITVKALTGEIYNFAHNKIWNAATTVANEIYGVDSQKAKAMVRYMQEYIGEATQANISSKHLFPTIAPDVIRTFRDYAMGSDKQRKKAWEKISKGDFEGMLSQELTDTIKDVAKNKHKFSEGDAKFITNIMKRIENNKQIINNKELYIHKPVTMRLSELARLGTLAEKYDLDIDQVKKDALLDTAKIAMKEQIKLKPTEAQANILRNERFVSELAKRMDRKHIVDHALVKSYKLMTDNTNVANSVVELMSITKGKMKKDWSAQFMLSAIGRKTDMLAEEIPKQFHNKVNFSSITSHIESAFNKVIKKFNKRGQGKVETSADEFSGHIKKSGIGLLFGSALAGYFAYQALKPYDDSWLGLDKGREYTKKTGKTDRQSAEMDMISSFDLPTDMNILGLPHGLNKHTARLMINRLKNPRLSYEDNLKGQYNAVTTLNRSPRFRNISNHGLLFERAAAITQRM